MKTRNVSMLALSAALVAGTAWAQDTQSGLASVDPAAGPAEAAVALPLDGTWLSYDEFMAEGSFFPDNWHWNSTDPVVVQVTDWAVVTDAFEVYDNGFLEFLTSPAAPAPNWDDLGFLDPFTSPPFTTDIPTAWNNPLFSKGQMQFDPGAHSITIKNTQIPPTLGGGPFPDSTVAIRAIAVANCDIKPGSFPNSINVNKKKGVTPVALLGSENVDVTAIDVSTLMFEGASPAHDIGDPYTYAGHLEDVNYDGYIDLVSHYWTPETNLNPGSTDGTISAVLGGVAFTCTDSVRVVGGGH